MVRIATLDGDGRLTPAQAPALATLGATATGEALIEAESAAAARSELGLGGAAVLAVGVTAGTVAAGDDSRITGAVQGSGLDADVTALDANPASALRVQQDARHLSTIDAAVAAANLSFVAEQTQVERQRAYTSQGPRTPRPMLVFIDDDGKSATSTVTAPLFAAKGVPFVAAVSTSLLDTAGYMTLTQVQALQAAGNEVASHLTGHSVISDLDLSPIAASRDWLAARGITCDHLVWVGGTYTEAAITEARKFYTSATSVVRGRNVPPLNQFTLRRFAVGSMVSNTTVDGILEDGSATHYTAMVNLARDNNALVVAMMHNWHSDFDATQQGRLSDMLTYAAAQGVEVVTMAQAMEVFGNSLDIGSGVTSLVIGADGASVGLPVRHLGTNPSGLNAASLGTAFPIGHISTAVYTIPSASGFPVSHAGILEHFYLNDQYAITQRWQPYASRLTYTRWYNGASSTWSTWSVLSIESAATATISMSATTVGAGASVDVHLTHPSASSISPWNLIVGCPQGGLEAGLIYTVNMWTNKTIIVRLHNVTGSPITTAVRNWRFKTLVD